MRKEKLRRCEYSYYLGIQDFTTDSIDIFGVIKYSAIPLRSNCGAISNHPSLPLFERRIIKIYQIRHTSISTYHPCSGANPSITFWVALAFLPLKISVPQKGG